MAVDIVNVIVVAAVSVVPTAVFVVIDILSLFLVENAFKTNIKRQKKIYKNIYK